MLIAQKQKTIVKTVITRSSCDTSTLLTDYSVDYWHYTAKLELCQRFLMAVGIESTSRDQEIAPTGRDWDLEILPTEDGIDKFQWMV